jgi:hypothetical protein
VEDVEGVRRLDPEAPLAEALRRGRDRCNARVAMARAQGLRWDEVAFATHLVEGVAPAVAAVARVAPGRVDAVVDALLGLSLELVARDVVGPSARCPLVRDAWRHLLPMLAPRLAEEPQRVAAAVTNGVVNLVEQQGARAADWLRFMGEVGPRVSAVEELLACGQVLAWRAGMAHLREAALAVWDALPEGVARETLGIPRDAVVSRERLRRDLEDPWHVPGVGIPSPALRVVGWVGGFRGFGGPFLAPPDLVVSAGLVWARDGEQAWSLHADCFGLGLQRGDSPEAVDNEAPAALAPDGTLTFHACTACLPGLAGASCVAATEHVVAVAFPRSHRVAVVARAGAVL